MRLSRKESRVFLEGEVPFYPFLEGKADNHNLIMEFAIIKRMEGKKEKMDVGRKNGRRKKCSNALAWL